VKQTKLKLKKWEEMQSRLVIKKSRKQSNHIDGKDDAERA